MPKEANPKHVNYKILPGCIVIGIEEQKPRQYQSLLEVEDPAAIRLYRLIHQQVSPKVGSAYESLLEYRIEFAQSTLLKEQYEMILQDYRNEPKRAQDYLWRSDLTDYEDFLGDFDQVVVNQN
jgi:hypothetical protein